MTQPLGHGKSWAMKRITPKKNPIPQAHQKPSALEVANTLGKHAQQLRFDWENVPEVAEQVKREWQELQEAMAQGDKSMIQMELGDLLFSAVQLARHLALDSEQTLAMANAKFSRRFRHMRQLMARDQVDMLELSMDAKEAYWKQVKELES